MRQIAYIAAVGGRGGFSPTALPEFAASQLRRQRLRTNCSVLGCLVEAAASRLHLHRRGFAARKKNMRLHLFAAVGLAVLLAGASPVSADPRPRQEQVKSHVPRIMTDVSAQQRKAKRKAARTGSRITVRPRSFLDAGTEVLPGERKFTDYALPPFYSPYSVLGPGRGFDRSPLNGPFDVPGNRFSW
jgi:hypothetical protein